MNAFSENELYTPLISYKFSNISTTECSIIITELWPSKWFLTGRSSCPYMCPKSFH